MQVSYWVSDMRKYFSFIKDLCTQTTVALVYSDHGKVETLVLLTMIDTQSLQSNHNGYVLSLWLLSHGFELYIHIYIYIYIYIYNYICAQVTDQQKEC